MKVRMKDNPELEFYSGKFNVHGIGEVQGCHESFGVDLFFIRDLDVFLEKNINFFGWKDMACAFEDHDLITDNFNTHFLSLEMKKIENVDLLYRRNRDAIYNTRGTG